MNSCVSFFNFSFIFWAAGRAVRFTPATGIRFPYGSKGASSGRSLPPTPNRLPTSGGVAAIPAALFLKNDLSYPAITGLTLLPAPINYQKY
jgi:hypothetical protein